MNGELGRKKTAKLMLINSMIELDIFTRVESLIKVTDFLKNTFSVSNADTVRWNPPGLIGVNKRIGVVAKWRAASGGNRALQIRGAGDFQRLRSTDAIRFGRFKNGNEIAQVHGVGNVAVAIDDQNVFASSGS